jgi:D-sedoheptulose 7-phosphate isomerase
MWILLNRAVIMKLSESMCMNTIDAVFLIGGRGSRLSKVINDRPKPMAEVGGRPFLEWLVLSFRAQGVRRFVFCVGYLGEVIEAYFEDGRTWGVEIVYSREAQPLGTGGAVKNALNQIQSDPFLVVNGDSYCMFSLQQLEDAHKTRSALATLWVTLVDECSRYGEVKIDEQGFVNAFLEKTVEKRAGLINTGICLLQKEVVYAIPSNISFSLEKDIFPALVGTGLLAVIGSGNFLDIGTPESYGIAWYLLKEDLNMLNNNEIDEKQLLRIQSRLEAGNLVRSMVFQQCSTAILQAVNALDKTFRQSGKLLLCGNGGSAADSQHMAAEFMSRLTKEFNRPGLPAIALTTDTSFLTAFANDCGFEDVFARQIQALGKPGDTLIAISTSGDSPNVVRAVEVSKKIGLHTIGLVGEGGKLSILVDTPVIIPSRNTQYVQEAMLAVEHIICDLTERALFDPEFGGDELPHE